MELREEAWRCRGCKLAIAFGYEGLARDALHDSDCELLPHPLRDEREAIADMLETQAFEVTCQGFLDRRAEIKNVLRCAAAAVRARGRK